MTSSDWETLFDAYRFDPESQLYHVRFRYLHPGLGRWLSRDPIRELGGLNLLQYVFNSPFRLQDPLGCKDFTPEELARGLDIALRGLCLRLKQLDALKEHDLQKWKELQKDATVVGRVGENLGEDPTVGAWEKSFDSWMQSIASAPSRLWGMIRGEEAAYSAYTESEIQRQLLFLFWLLEQAKKSPATAE